jgi:hypothetical protein
MFSVIASYLKFHYTTAYVEGIRMLAPHGIALYIVGIPLFIVWTLLPFVILGFLSAGIYLTFLWNAL